MSHRKAMTEQLEDPDHPIIERPNAYAVVGLYYHRTLDDSEEAYIDLTLQKGDVVRRLRFLSPQQISVGEGFPHGIGLYIADVRARGLEGLNVHVDDYECSGGEIRFWAREVIDLDDTEKR